LIYFKCSDYSVGVLDRSDWQLNTVNTGAIFYDIAYSEHTNTLYLTCNDGKIRFIKGKNLLQTDLYITDLPVTLLYDNVNNRMFIHAYTVQTIDDNPFQLEEELFVYDELNQNLLNIGFDNMEKRMAYQSQIGLDVPDHDIIYNPDDEIVYLADGHSVLNVVDMKETCAQEDYDNYVIDDSETWMDDKYISRYIVIEDGGSLEIESTSTVHLMTNAKITVKPGGELIVNGGKLTSACEGYWWGIELQGNREENQFDRSNQGYLELQHHATIEYSVNGILAAGTRFPLALDLTRTGGIINADTAIFHNNLRCVDIESYTNHHPYNGDPWSNLSNFTACEFINDRDNPYENYHLNEMIHLSEIQGITFYGCAFELSDHLAEASSIYNQLVRLDNCENMIFKGCTFHNYLPDHLCDADKIGVAIASYNSGVTVNYICTAWGLQDCVEWIPSEFDGFSWAIVASDEGLNFPVAIDKVEFINNLRGIYLSGLTDPQITSNDFDMYTDFDVADHQTYIYGLYLDVCPTYHIEANRFSTYVAYDSTFGTVIKGCGPLANEIYSNTYDSLDIGIEAIGYNRGPNDGLCIKCNDFIYNKMDIYVGGYTPGPAYGHGIAMFQGIPAGPLDSDPRKPAGNTFSDFTGHQYDLDNELDTIVYVYHGINPSPYKIIPDHLDGKIGLHRNERAEYTKANACPSQLNGGGSQTFKLLMVLYEQQADSTQTLLNALVDGGNTKELNTDVIMSIPDESLEVNQLLLDESPYLSDTVMKSAIYKEDVLPNAMIRDIMVANPQSAKSQGVINALNNRWDPMPEYMMDEIMAGKDSLGNKEIMEAHVNGYRHLRILLLTNWPVIIQGIP